MRHNHAPLLGIHKIYLHLVKLPDQFRRQRIPRVAQRRDAAVMQRQDTMRKRQRVLRVMRGQKHGIALLRQAAHAGKHAQLIAKVQAAGGLVHHQDPRLLAQRAPPAPAAARRR